MGSIAAPASSAATSCSTCSPSGLASSPTTCTRPAAPTPPSPPTTSSGPDRTRREVPPPGRRTPRCLKGGICEVGGGVHLSKKPPSTTRPRARGASPSKARCASPLPSAPPDSQWSAKTSPSSPTLVALDPQIHDVYGFPIPRITRSSHPFGARCVRVLRTEARVDLCGRAPEVLRASWMPVGALVGATGRFNSPYAGAASTAHIMGAAHKGNDAATSVVDAHGAMHDVGNVFVTDGSVFRVVRRFQPEPHHHGPPPYAPLDTSAVLGPTTQLRRSPRTHGAS